MRKLGRVMAVVMLVFYGLAISHCLLEQVPGLSFLSCCEHEESAPHQDDDCRQDVCSLVEFGFYKANDHDDTLAVPFLAIAVLPAPLSVDLSGEVFCSRPFSSIPPELPRAWQFRFRTALPPRAPSFVS